MPNLPTVSAFNDGYIAEMYESFVRDPASVDESWRQFFRTAAQFAGGEPAKTGGYDESLLRKAVGAASLIHAIQHFGHLAVQLDPLGTPPPGAAELHPEYHGVTESDLQRIPASAVSDWMTGTAADVVQKMRERYSSTLALEAEHITDESEREWFRTKMETGDATLPLTKDERLALFHRLTRVDGLEHFLGVAYPTVKRFAIEGVDALVPMLDEAITRGAHAGARRVVIGMAHRGRLNVLTHVMGKPYRHLLDEFEGRHPPMADNEFGDVKYHMGYRGQCEVPGAGTVLTEVLANPSHLELVNPVCAGVARAQQRVRGAAPNTRDESRVLPIVVHGDASFPGEGIVPETLNLALLRGYRVGGSLHIILNNQVGFTTDPIDARSMHYASDLAKGFEIPIIHVNGDNAEACVHAVRLGVDYRKRFGKDFLIDLVGYRRHGHNEADQPAFTQPLMYAKIAAHKTPRQIYAAQLVGEGLITEQDVAAAEKAVTEQLQKVYQEMKKSPEDNGAPPQQPSSTPVTYDTAVRGEKLIALNEQLLTWPASFKLHATMQRTLPRRRDAINTGGIDWGHAESLAFASLLTEGVSVRITGQDAERGTFSHRQAVLHDMNTGETYTPLAHLPQASGEFEIYNSPLSETAVMGFEYGFSIAAPDELVVWEAQYGDFANVAQPVVDQYLSAARSKWRQDSGLVLLLPHGYEGQGPEHSSARLERYLQLAAEDNMTVAYPSSPAQYFHVLRRQVMRRPRKPLVLMQPKSLLRLPAAASSLEQLTTGMFRPVLDDPMASQRRDAVQRLVFCTGRIYYDLATNKPANVAVIRVEELAPWPRDIVGIVDQYANVEEVVWAQEEPKNMGAWTYVQPRLRASIGTLTTLRYVGRPERSSPAEGYQPAHNAEQARIVHDVLTYAPAPKKRERATR